MKSGFAGLLALTLSISPVSAQAGPWQQCGGRNHQGPPTCVNGYICTFINDWYSQCTPGQGTSTQGPTTTPNTPTTTQAPTTTTAKPGVCSGTAPARKFKWIGVNQSGAEFGENVLPGQLGTHYTWPSQASVDFFVSKGMNIFRVNTKMERFSQQGINGPLDQTYLDAFIQLAQYISNKGAYVIADPHNYGRFNKQIITDVNGFGNWCERFANAVKHVPNLIFDTNNEFHTMSQDLVFNLNQACINGIRKAGATHPIMVEGNAWSGAWSWVSSGNAASLINLEDPNDNLIFQMHQYLDSDSSGTSPTCVSPTILRERLREATNWLVQNNKKGFLGEVGAGSNDACIQALIQGFCDLAQVENWLGITWWSSGPWWADYMYSMEPPNGPAIARILPEVFEKFI